MKILICDDVIKEAEEVKELIESYKIYNSEDVSVSTPEQLLIDLEDNLLDCELLILDIEFHQNDYNGIDIGRMVNQKLPGCQIIYLTGILEFAPDVYETRHCYFVMKDNMKRMLPRALEKVKEEKNKQKESVMTFVSQGKKMYIDLSEILYIEKKQRQLHIVTKESKYECYSSLKKIVSGFEDKMIRCHGGFVVNLDFIRVLQREEVVLQGGVQIPIGRTYREKFMQHYLAYCAGRM